MNRLIPVTTLFLDVGGILLTDGWDHHARARVATNFNLDLAEMEDRHHLNFDTYEERPFTKAQFRKFIIALSKLYLKMFELLSQLKAQNGLKVFVARNKARELNLHRIRKFKLSGFVDSFISSSLVHIRMPDAIHQEDNQIIGLAISGAAFQFQQLVSFKSYVAIGGLVIYVTCFAFGLGPIFWLLISEIFPLKIRGAAMSAVTVTNGTLNLVVSVNFLTLFGILVHLGTFWPYGAIAFGVWVFFYLLALETKGETLEQIEAHMAGGKTSEGIVKTCIIHTFYKLHNDEGVIHETS